MFVGGCTVDTGETELGSSGANSTSFLFESKVDNAAYYKVDFADGILIVQYDWLGAK